MKLPIRSRHSILAAVVVIAAICVPLVGSIGSQPPEPVPPPIAVRAAGRGNPYVNLGDGVALQPRYTGHRAAATLLAAGTARPLALASDDFDKDGVPDVIASWDAAGSGAVSLHRASFDARYPYSEQARRHREEGTFVAERFMPEAIVFEIPEPAELVAAGDFDADGNQDLAAAPRHADSLTILHGDGAGGFRPPESLKLPGSLTALAAVDFNRRNGYEEILAAVAGPDGARLLVYESYEGAVRAEPETIPLPAPATAMATGRLDAHPLIDLAVTAGDRLVIVPGRDRRLYTTGRLRDQAGKLSVQEVELPGPAETVAVGDFDGDVKDDVAVRLADGRLWLRLAAETANPQSMALAGGPSGPADKGGTRLVTAAVSSRPGRNLLLMEQSAGRLRLLMPEKGGPAPEPVDLEVAGRPVAVLPIFLNGDGLSDLVVLSEAPASLSVSETMPLATFTVNNPSDSGAGSLRSAITNANSNPGADMIVINIPFFLSHTITPLTELPAITEAATIDASPELLPSGAPGVVLSGSSCGSACDGLTINTQDTIIRGLAVNNFSNSGVRIFFGTHNSVRACFIGVSPDGTTAAGNQYGVLISDTNAPDVGGGSSADGNLISGNTAVGVYMLSTTIDGVVQFSSIGMTRNGLSPLPNSAGVVLSGDDGGVAFNTISGNGDGVRISGRLNLVRFNVIGTDPTGVLAVPNNNGVRVSVQAESNDIGQNRISGNGLSGVSIIDNSTLSLVRQNMIGLKASDPPEPLPNGMGVTIDGAYDNTIDSNYISGNLGPGVRIRNQASNNDVDHNWIGIGDDLVTPVGNGGAGVQITDSSVNNVGGDHLEGTGNVISANSGPGVLIEGESAGNKVNRNSIGTNVTGTAPLGNVIGILIKGASFDNRIGVFASTRNIISGNGTNLIIQNDGLTRPTSDQVEHNCFGTDASCTMALGSGGDNVVIRGAASVFLESNVLGGNHTSGLRIIDSESVGLYSNSIGIGEAGAALGHSGPGVVIEGSSSRVRIGSRFSKSGSLRNRIANNSGDGIQVLEPAADTFLEDNLIHANGGLGINLGTDGPTPNDSLDADTGPNKGQNFPVLTAAATSGGNVTVEGTLHSTPDSSFLLDLYASTTCDPSGHGEGERSIGYGTVTTAADGNTPPFSFTFLSSVSPSEYITATATSQGTTSDTSEFSACFQPGGTPPMTIPPTMEMAPGEAEMMWEPIAGAQWYTLYRGLPADLVHLPATSLTTLQGGPNACTRWSGTTPSTGPILTEQPAPGSFFWYLISATGLYGEGGVGEGSLGPRQIVSSGPCTGSFCPHDKCIEGDALSTNCGGCVASICAVDPYCCITAWDDICVGEVRTVCNNLTCLESAGSCSHTLCSFGPTLTPGCDVPPLSTSCVAQVCAADPFCCQDHWDSICMDEVTTICGNQCD